MGSHAGTHLDAPRHLFPDGMSLDQYPPQRFQGEAVVLRLDGHLEIPDRVAMVLFATGWGPKWGTAAYRSGYPTLTGEQMEILVEKGIQMVGFDCPSPDVLDELPCFSARAMALRSGFSPVFDGKSQKEMVPEKSAVV